MVPQQLKAMGIGSGWRGAALRSGSTEGLREAGCWETSLELSGSKHLAKDTVFCYHSDQGL